MEVFEHRELSLQVLKLIFAVVVHPAISLLILLISILLIFLIFTFANWKENYWLYCILGERMKLCIVVTLLRLQRTPLEGISFCYETVSSAETVS